MMKKPVCVCVRVFWGNLTSDNVHIQNVGEHTLKKFRSYSYLYRHISNACMEIYNVISPPYKYDQPNSKLIFVLSLYTPCLYPGKYLKISPLDCHGMMFMHKENYE